MMLSEIQIINNDNFLSTYVQLAGDEKFRPPIRGMCGLSTKPWQNVQLKFGKVELNLRSLQGDTAEIIVMVALVMNSDLATKSAKSFF